MNKEQKIVLISTTIIIIASLIIWQLYGGEIFTKTQVLLETKDELFPEMTQKVWVDRFVWGLDLSAAIIGMTILSAAILFFLFRDKKKSFENYN